MINTLPFVFRSCLWIIHKYLQLLVQHERQVVNSLNESKLLVVTNSSSPGRGNNPNQGKDDQGDLLVVKGEARVYSHYGMANHVVDNCFKAYGYLPQSLQNGMVKNYASNGGHEDDSLSEANRISIV